MALLCGVGEKGRDAGCRLGRGCDSLLSSCGFSSLLSDAMPSVLCVRKEVLLASSAGDLRGQSLALRR